MNLVQIRQTIADNCLKTPLRYQLWGVAAIENADGAIILADEMGLGKTVQALMWAALYPQLRPVVVICPAQVKLQWEKEIQTTIRARSNVFICNGMRPEPIPEDTDFIIANYRILQPSRRKKGGRMVTDPSTGWQETIRKASPHVVMIDECFPKGTDIATDHGVFPIDFIVENKSQVQVLSYNSLSFEVEWKPIVHYMKNRRKQDLVRISLSDGRSVVCTANHKIWEVGLNDYKQAKALDSGDILRNLPKAFYRADVAAKWEASKKVLRNKLLGKVEDGPARSCGEGQQSQQREEVSRPCNVRRTQGDAFPIDDREEQRPEFQSEGRCLEEGEALARNQRGERPYIETPTTPSRQFEGIGDGVHGENRLSEATLCEGSPRLQDRCGPSGSEDSHRSGRTFSQDQEGPSDRPKEGCSVDYVRVESVEVLEPGSDGRFKGCFGEDIGECDTVYNIEVADNHNYFAQGVLVSNCQNIKNWSTGATKGVRHLSKDCKRIIPISGTPIENSPFEFFTPLMLVAPGVFPYNKFIQRYCINMDPKANVFNYKGANHTEELHRLTKPYIIRRLKKDVAMDLPDKRSTVVRLGISNRKEYELAKNDMAKWIKKRKKVGKKELQSKVDALKLLTWEGKKKSAVLWLKEIIDTGEKLIVYARRAHILDTLMEAFPKVAVRMDGKVTGTKREAIKQRFIDDPSIRLMVANYEVVVGVDGFQGVCSNTAWVELPWKPSELDQANDRVHRIGQTNKVNAWFLLGADTVEEDLAYIVDNKREVVSQVLDGKAASSADMLTSLANMMGVELK